MKTANRKELFFVIVFVIVFGLLVSALTFLYYPKWDSTNELAQYSGMYEEDKDTLDVIYLGSCNMYTSMSPTLVWEKYGITGYAMTCPDQSLSTSYYYLKDALKKQSPKVVVVESLFLQHTSVGETRPKYNRFALDYMPMSMNKLKLAADLTDLEMQSTEEVAGYPSRFTTYMSYMFPIIKYHSRDDVTAESITDFYDHDEPTFFNKGGWAQYNYCLEENLTWDEVHNDLELNPNAEEYFPKIVELCKDKGIKLIVMKSPNYMRWGHDDTYTKTSREYVKSFGIPFIDMQSDKYNDFENYDYGYGTGRLNIYGMKRLSLKMGDYLVNTMGLKKTDLTEEQTHSWQKAVDRLYEYAAKKGMSITPGQIAQITCLKDGLCVRWNTAEDCSSYSIFRCREENGKYEEIASGVHGNTYNDTDVEDCAGYSYYVVPEKGSLKGQASDPKYYVFVPMLKNVSATNNNGAVMIKWTEPYFVGEVRIDRRSETGLNYSTLNTQESVGGTASLENTSVEEGKLYRYRVYPLMKKDDTEFYGCPSYVYATPEKSGN